MPTTTIERIALVRPLSGSIRPDWNQIAAVAGDLAKGSIDVGVYRRGGRETTQRALDSILARLL